MSAADPATTAQELPDAVKGGMGQMHKVHVRTGGPLGSIAKELLGEDTPENRHHLWDWNRDILPSPEATVPSGTDLTVAEPGFISGGPSLGELKRADLTHSDLKGASTVSNGGKSVEEGKSSIGQRLARTGDASVPEGEDLQNFGSEGTGARLSEGRRAREGMTRGDGGTNSDAAHRHVGEGSDGALAQSDQDRREAAEGGAAASGEGASGSAQSLPTGAEGGEGGGEGGGDPPPPAEGDFHE